MALLRWLRRAWQDPAAGAHRQAAQARLAGQCRVAANECADWGGADAAPQTGRAVPCASDQRARAPIGQDR